LFHNSAVFDLGELFPEMVGCERKDVQRIIFKCFLADSAYVKQIGRRYCCSNPIEQGDLIVDIEAGGMIDGKSSITTKKKHFIADFKQFLAKMVYRRTSQHKKRNHY